MYTEHMSTSLPMNIATCRPSGPSRRRKRGKKGPSVVQRDVRRIRQQLKAQRAMRVLGNGGTLRDAAKAAGTSTRTVNAILYATSERLALMSDESYDDLQHRRYVPPSVEGMMPQQAVELRLKGHTYSDIAARLMIPEQRARDMVWAELERLDNDELRNADRARRLHVERMEMLFFRAYKKGDLSTALKIMERQAKLLGLDAPVKIDVESRLRAIAEAEGLDPDAAVKEVERLMQEMKL